MPHQLVQSRLPIPGPRDIVFAIVLVLVLAGGRHALFNDPGTYWHLRLGHDILATASAPRCDSLTFTRFQEPWIDQSWGFDVLLAVVVDQAGWSGAAALTALGLAWVYASLTRDLIQEGASPVASVVVSLLTAAIGCIHFLIRPHVFTLAFVYLSFRLCRKQYEQGGWAIAWIPVLTAILANLHGGFVALPLIVACAGGGRAVSDDKEGKVGAVARFALIFAACCLASLANPYGLDLHRHVVKLLFTSGVTGLIDEYKSAPFGQPEARVLEMTVLALIALPSLSNRKIDRYHLVHVLVWLHLALTSIRNAPFFALAVAPVLAGLLDSVAPSLQTGWTERPGRSPWRWAVAAGLLALIAARVPLGSPDPAKWPLEAVAVLDSQSDRQRLFHEQDWGGLIASECRNRRSYIDDRFELFGAKTVLEYVAALGGGPEWDAIRDRERIDAVWIKPDRGLARRLTDDPGWSVAHRGAASILFRRIASPTGPETAPVRVSRTTPLRHQP
jgi:hypothetical protein